VGVIPVVFFAGGAVDVVVVGEGHLVRLVGPPAHRKIARGDEDQVAVEDAVAEGAATVHGRLEAVIRAEGDEGGGAGIQFRHRGRGEELVGVAGVDRLAGGRVHGEDAPAGVFVFGAVEDGLEMARQGGGVLLLLGRRVGGNGPGDRKGDEAEQNPAGVHDRHPNTMEAGEAE
jgi:hypothetical protein